MSGRWRFELHDLTRPHTEESAVQLFGDIGSDDYCRVDVDYLATWETANGTVARLSLLDHLSTHVDAPIHTNEDGYDLSRLDISRLIGEAVVLDLRREDPDHGYTTEDLAQATPAIEPGDIVLIHSGYREAASREERIHQTYLTPEAAQWLVDRGVKAVGCEPAGIEHVPDGYFVKRWYAKDTENPPSWPAHRILLGNDVYIVEGLADLSAITGQRVRFAALPLRVPGLSGCPVRAVAWIDA
jgi:kynurenine formamidase